MKKFYKLFLILITALIQSSVLALDSYNDVDVLAAPNKVFKHQDVSSQCADRIVANLPYIHSENTGVFGNNYSGTPGKLCGVSDSYLNGSEVVYTYTASSDDNLTIRLTDLKQYYSGIFIYDSCENIGKECLASAVSGPSRRDLLIQDFFVENGRTYYIVVSSWLTPNIDYTINISGFSCSDIELPYGSANQLFVTGDTVEDLEVKETHSGATFRWYEDAALANEITDINAHALQDSTAYYVTQTINKCESSALRIFVEKLDCKKLNISNTTSGEVTCRGLVTLQAEPSGLGTDIYWYDSATNGRLLGKGNTLTTPELTQTTSYWVSETYVKGMFFVEGLGKKSNSTNTTHTPSGAQDFGLLFEATQSFILAEVEVFSTGAGGTLEIELREKNTYGNVIENTTVNIQGGGSASNPISNKITLDFKIPGSGEYYLAGFNGPSMIRDGGGENNNFPYSLGSFGEITSGHNWNNTFTNSYYYFYNWTILETNDLICESPRQEVIVTVNQFGDFELNYSDLPFVDTNSTSLFGNDFTGDAGIGCYGENYLNGYETTYYYKSNPNKDDIIKIELSDYSNPNAAIFVYRRCGDIGIKCLSGATSDNDTNEIVIEDLYVEAGEDLLILVSSSTGSTDYTLNVEGIDCSNVYAPIGNPIPHFVNGNVVSDLTVSGSIHNEGFAWYSDASLTKEISNPSIEPIVNGSSYYVTQTLLGCESSGFEITPVEFNCSSLNVNVGVNEYYICGYERAITLSSVSSKTGSETYWYDKESGGNIIGIGDEFIANIKDPTTSFWVSEVLTRQPIDTNEPLPTYCKPVAPNYGCTTPHNINGFTLNTASDIALIRHLESYCSPEGYTSFTKEDSLIATLIAGETYSFQVDHLTDSQYIRIWIDFNGNGSFEDAGELLYENTTPKGNYLPTTGTFQIPSDITSGTSVMRIRSTFLPISRINSKINSCEQETNTGEVHDYKVILIGSEGEVLCESPRQEVKVIVNEEVTPPPVITGELDVCEEGMLSDITELGENIKWYDRNGKELAPYSIIVEGQKYYATQIIQGCESEMIEVVMEFKKKSDKPLAAVNQVFQDGDDLTALEVIGENLTWYEDRWKVKEIPATTILQNQTTYYVTQTLDGKCESELLSITVHEALDVKDILFNAFEFHPNPVNGVLFISNTHSIDKIEIFDLTGRKVYVNKYNSSSIEINLSELSTGTYLMNATVGNMAKMFRVIKK